MKPGQVSDLIQLGTAYTLFRLERAHPGGHVPIRGSKGELLTDLQKQKNEQLRKELNKRLRKTAKIEVCEFHANASLEFAPLKCVEAETRWMMCTTWVLKSC